MNFSSEWNNKYSNNEHMSIWPWSDLVSYVKANCDFSKKPFKVLELGCGAGANIPFFQSLDVDYYALEGSEYIVNQLRKRFPQYVDNIKQSDFTVHIPFEFQFDLIVDRGSITHNTTAAIKQCLALLRDCMATNGIFMGIDWFSTEHAEYRNGEPDEDLYTRRNFNRGGFSGVGRVHFSDEKHLEDLFEPALILEKMEHKIVSPYRGEIAKRASWNLLARKIYLQS